MGVHGLWRLIESSGEQIPLESLENKVLAVDISIWLHQVIKGYHDARGQSIPNAHLLGVFHRLCKLLYYKIRPVFVFDGEVPYLKKQTIAKRNELKYRNEDESERLHQQILSNLLKKAAISTAIAEEILKVDKKISPVKKQNKNDDNLFVLPEIEKNQLEEEDSSEDEHYKSTREYIDIDLIDVKSDQFKSLPADVRHDILTELKERSKHTSWHKLRIMSKESNDFSNFQMKKLLKRRSFQVSLEEAEKEMGGHTLSLNDLEALLSAEGIVEASKSLATKRIASNEKTTYLLIKDLQKTLKGVIKDGQTEKNDEIKLTLNDKQKIEICKEPEIEENDKKLIEKSKNLEQVHKNILKQLEEQKRMLNFKEEEKKEIIFSSEDSDLETAIKLSLEPHKEESDMETAIKLSLEDTNRPSTSKMAENYSQEFKSSQSNSMDYLKNFKDEDFVSSSSDEEFVYTYTQSTSLTKPYLIEYTDFTPFCINKILDVVQTDKVESNEEYFLNEMNLNSPALKKNDTKLKIDDNVEIISSSTDSDLEEVGINDEKKINQIEVVIKPDEIVEDDLFSDVFKQSDLNLKTVNESNSDISLKLNKISDKELFKIDDVKNETNKKSSEGISIKQDNNLENVSNEIKLKHVEENIIEYLDKVQENNKDKNDLVLKEQLNYVENKQIKDDINNIETNACENIKNNLNKNDNEINEEEAKIELNVETTDRIIKDDNELSQKENEHITIVSLPNKILKNQIKYTTDQLRQMQEELDTNNQELIKEMGRKDRLAMSMSERIYQETQELLTLFGIPYIVAPMEAEAQCAFLNEINLTDGTITDDSDIWLFGGKTVYKNFFSSKKHVLQFRIENIYKHFKLTRKELILLALLVGSDYTLGLQGVGPVTALEIISSFPTDSKEENLISGLIKFRNWLRSDKSFDVRRRTLRTKLRNISLTENFPNPNIVSAYLEPKIDNSSEKFTWGQLQEDLIYDYTRAKFGWSELKAREVLSPLLKRLKDKSSQKNLLNYYNILNANYKPNPNLSKRVKAAVQKLEGGDSSDSSEFETASKRTKLESGLAKRKSSKKGGKHVSKNKKGNLKDLDLKSKNMNSNEEALLSRLEHQVKKHMQSDKSKEVIPQREQDRKNALKTRLRAIELYRKSKNGPGFVAKNNRSKLKVKEDAKLSESSDSS